MSKFRKGATPQFGIVYFFVGKTGASLTCKIGFTGGDVWERLRQIQSCSPVELDIFGYFAGSLKLEKMFHETFAPVRLHGEWFHAEGKLEEFIGRLADCGAAKRLTTTDEMLRAVSDIIFAREPLRPWTDASFYESSANPQVWEPIFA